METREVIQKLRLKHGMSQDELAEKVFVTRQAVSRWETGETTPNTETLKLLSNLFNVSINTLLGSPKTLICQCCGMPLEDDIISRNADGTMNEDYCKWCYANGEYTYSDMDELIEVSVKHMADENFSEDAARAYMKQRLPELDYWKRFDELSDNGEFEGLKRELIEEINDLDIKGMPEVRSLNALVGKFVNIEYHLPGGMKARFLDDEVTYLGNQLESEKSDDFFYGVIACRDFILICAYEKDVKNPELIFYRNR